MKVKICSSCGKIIDSKKTTCKTCKSNYCASCKKIIGKSCLCCGTIDND